jgi:hypothetical protein
MPLIPRLPNRLAPLDRSFEIAHDHERALALAFEAALPIIRRRPERAVQWRDHPAAPVSRAAGPATQGR